jgi:hypothetical protein
MAELSEPDLAALASKVSSFLAGLSEPEREFLAGVLAAASAVDESADVEGFGYRRSDQVQGAIYAQEQAINRLGSEGFDVAARDRRKAGMDNIQKFLDIVRSMNPQI